MFFNVVLIYYVFQRLNVNLKKVIGSAALVNTPERLLKWKN